MYELKNSGLPLYMDEKTNIAALSAVLKFGGYARKTTDKMAGLLADETDLLKQAAEPFYDVYRDIYFPEDDALLRKNNYRYDITIIMPGEINGECKKTSGHYHGWNPERTNTYAEVYEVISGTALYILQKSPNFDAEDSADVKVDDLILVTVPEGKTLLVPPNYGHCSVNIGKGPLVFSNLAYIPCPIHYDAVKYYHGMSFYAFREGGKISLKYNDHYKDVPKPKFATVKENQKMGIEWGLPVYESYRRNPNAFDFLGHPDAYIDEIMGMLEYHDSFVQPE